MPADLCCPVAASAAAAAILAEWWQWHSDSDSLACRKIRVHRNLCKNVYRCSSLYFLNPKCFHAKHWDLHPGTRHLCCAELVLIEMSLSNPSIIEQRWVHLLFYSGTVGHLVFSQWTLVFGDMKNVYHSKKQNKTNSSIWDELVKYPAFTFAYVNLWPLQV